MFRHKANPRCLACRIQDLLSEAQPDPSMAGALPPGAWWRAGGTGASTVDAVSTNGSTPGVQPYRPDAGDAAVLAARRSALELREVHFAYPLRPGSFGESGCGLDPGPEQFWVCSGSGQGLGESSAGVPIAHLLRPGGHIENGSTPPTDRQVKGIHRQMLRMAGVVAWPLQLSVPAWSKW